MDHKALAPYLERVRSIKMEDLPGATCSCHVCKVATPKGGETVPKDDKFIAEELALAATLLKLWEDAVASTGIVDSITTAGATRNTHTISTALDNADVSLSQTIFDDGDGEATKDTMGTLRKTLLVGMLLSGAALTDYSRLMVSINRLLGGFTAQVRYFSNQYFTRIAHPALMDAVLSAGTSLTGLEDYGKVLADEMAKAIWNTGPYWRIVANQTTSRAHHYGILRGAQEQGKLGYKLVAVLDRRTTELCRNLDGKEFWVADGIAHLERIAETEPEDIAKVAPWVKAEDVKDKSASDLSTMGVLVPPFHANCRTTLVAIST